MSLRMRVVLDLIVICGAAAIFLCTGDAQKSRTKEPLSWKQYGLHSNVCLGPLD